MQTKYSNQRNLNYAAIAVDTKKTGHNIWSKMNEKGITVKALAETLDLSCQAVYGYINGTRTPTIAHFIAIAHILGTSIEELVSVDVAEAA